MKTLDLKSYYVLLDKNDDIQGMDTSSGGYHYPVTYIGGVHFWHEREKEQMDKYAAMFNLRAVRALTVI